MVRRCSRVGCSAHAAVTLSYVYADRMAVVGPLSPVAEPHTYDLCGKHAEHLTAPRGWTVLRQADPEPEDDEPIARVFAFPDPAEVRARLQLALRRP